MKWKSLIQTDPSVSFLSGRHGTLHKHHCLHGTANRRKAEQDGLLLTNMEEFLHTCDGDFVLEEGLKNPYAMYEELNPETKDAIERLRYALLKEIDYITPENRRKSFALKTVLTDIINDYLM